MPMLAAILLIRCHIFSHDAALMPAFRCFDAAVVCRFSPLDFAIRDDYFLMLIRRRHADYAALHALFCFFFLLSPFDALHILIRRRFCFAAFIFVTCTAAFTMIY